MDPKQVVESAVKKSASSDVLKKRYSTSVETKRLPKNVKNVLKNEKTNETISIPPIRDLNSLQQISDPNSKPFFYGNPFVEKHKGVMHLRTTKNEGEAASATAFPSTDCSMIVMTDVPAFFTCRELVNFVRPAATDISLMKVLRDEAPNKYMVAIKFKNPKSAISFFEQYNDIEFNSIEPEKCTLHFIDSIEEDEATTTIMGLVADPTYGETPTCSVCLEKMDENNVLVILCNHSFHAECIGQWADTTCPICRYAQTPELVPDQKCFDCGRTTDLWMCLICGNVGCGRYSEAHAYKHFEKTSHIFTLQVGGKLVWDYAGDNYVHRLIENSTDGKPVEYDGGGAGDCFEKENEKISAVQLEYTCLLTSQLENQRLFYEEKLREAEEKFNEHGREAHQKINALESELKNARKECSSLKEELSNVTATKKQLDKKYQLTQTKCQNLQKEFDEEKQLCTLLRKDKDTLKQQKEELENLRKKEITSLEEQLHDLMMHFETQGKIQQQVDNGTISKEELEQSNVEVKEDEKNAKKGTRKRANKK